MTAGKNTIKQWSVDDRPREKLVLKGASGLSNSELLAILINHGTKEKSALDLSKEILELVRNSLSELGKLSLKELMQVKGIGEAKAVTLLAAMELGRRRHTDGVLEKAVIRTSMDIAGFLKVSLKDLNHEVFAVVFLNRANKVNHFEIISKGGITGTVADPRIIMKKALEEEAVSIILCHNHPSGNLKPSRADEELTLKIKEAGRYFDIKVLDHIIISDEGYYSFADDGIL